MARGNQGRVGDAIVRGVLPKERCKAGHRVGLVLVRCARLEDASLPGAGKVHDHGRAELCRGDADDDLQAAKGAALGELPGEAVEERLLLHNDHLRCGDCQNRAHVLQELGMGPANEISHEPIPAGQQARPSNGHERNCALLAGVDA